MASLKIKKSKGWGGARPGAGRPRKDPQNNTAAWEGAQLYQPGRHYLYLPTLDARMDFESQTRTDLLKKAWWLYHNIGLARRAVDGVARYTVGTGLRPQARSGDEDWNDLVEATFQHSVCNVPWAFDVSGACNFLEAQSMVIRHAAIGGDIFGQFAKSAENRALMRFIPGEFVGNSYKRATGYDEDKWQDGVMCDPVTMRPLKYRVLKDPTGQDFTDVPAEQMLHIRRVHRFGYTRSPSWLAAAANHLQDMTEMTSYTKQSFKLAAQVGFVLTTAEAGKVALGGAITRKRDADNGEGVTYDEVYSASGIPQLKPGESIQAFQNQHPGESFEPFMKYLARDIAWGMGISPEILWDITSAGGANTRFALADAQTFFEELRAWLINSFCRPFYTYWLWHEIEAGRIPARDDWSFHEWTAPPDVTVDFGRDTKALLEIVRQGGISPKRFGEILGFDEDREEDDIISAAVRRRAKIAEVNAEYGMDLSYDQVFNSAAVPAQAAAPAPGRRTMEEIEEMEATAKARAVPQNFNFNLPGQAAPVVNIAPAIHVPQAHVDVHPPSATAPVVNVTTAQPLVTVAPPVVQVAAPEVNIAPANVSVAAPVVHVAAAESPLINISVPKALREIQTVSRDRDNEITGSVTDIIYDDGR